METHVYGSLTISAGTPVLPFPILDCEDSDQGFHTQSRHLGAFQTLALGPSYVLDEIAIPNRGKLMKTTVLGDNIEACSEVSSVLRAELSILDSQHGDSRNLFKLNEAMLTVASKCQEPFVSVINTIGEHSTFALMASGIALDVVGVFDTVNKSVRLIWSTDEMWISDIKASNYTRYIFYRYPVMYDRPLFIYSQAVCSKWLKWTREFQGSEEALLKRFNALENFLFKNPETPTLK